MNATIRVDGLNAASASATKVSLASPAAYRSHGIEMLPIHSQMRFSLVPSGKSYIIRVSSTGGVKEPFVNFLVTVTGNGSTVTREYAAFFNPNPAMAPGSHDKPTVVVEKTSKPQHKVIAQRSEKPEPSRNRSSANTSGWGGKTTNPKPAPERKSAPVRPTPAPSPAAAVKGSPNTPDFIPVGSNYGPIKPGETLYSIAKAARPSESIRVYDMMRLIYKSNRRAFIGNDMGNLMAGVTLHIPDPGKKGSTSSSAKPAPEKKPAPKPEPKPQSKPVNKVTPAAPPPVERTPAPKPIPTPKPAPAKPQVPESTPASAAAQLAFGIDDQKKPEEPPKSIPTPPPPVPTPAPPAAEAERDSGLKLDAPETIKPEETKPPVEIPPPVIEIPVAEVTPPQPEPKPEPPPAPVQPRPVPKPIPAPAPQPAPVDDSLFGLGLSLPILGGIVAGILGLLGGLFWWLQKRKARKEDEIEEFTPEQINQMVAEMEKEHGDLDFDQLSNLQDDGISSVDEPVSITKLDPISEPYPAEERHDSNSGMSSLDDFSDDFFKDLEVGTTDNSDPIADPTFTDPALDNTIADVSELGDDFFTDLDFDDNATTSAGGDDFSLDKQSPAASEDKFDNFFSEDNAAADTTELDFFDGAEDNAKAEPTPAPALSDSDDGLDFFDHLEDDKPSVAEAKPATVSDDLGGGLDFFTNDEPTPAPKPEPKLAPKDDAPLDFFTDSTQAATEDLDDTVDFFADDEFDAVPPKRPAAPKLAGSDSGDNSIDFFADPTLSDPEPANPVPPPPPPPKLVTSKPPAPKLAKKSPPPPAASEVDEEAMEINLDMATSFITMGKSSKARDWLEEVLVAGTEEQKARANAMLAKIEKG